MGIILFIIFGFFVGLLARAVLPGRQRMGLFATSALGMAGSFLGGFLAALITHDRAFDLNTAGLIGSLIGAVLLLIIGSRFSRRSSLA